MGHMDEIIKALQAAAPFIAVLFLRDLSKAMLSRLAKKVKETPDPADDWLGDVAIVIIGTIDKLPGPSLLSKKGKGE